MHTLSSARALFALCAVVAATSCGAVEWSLTVEKGGATNVVTAANCRFAIDVSVEERDGAWSGKIVNREKGAIVLGFEMTAEPLDVVEGKSALYVPHVYGRRIRNWPKHGEDQVGVPMWRETADGVFVPFMSQWDVSTGSRAAPLPYPSKICTMQWATLNDGKGGFYLASEDPLAGAKDIQIEYDSNTKRIAMGFNFPMFLREGETFTVPRVVMKKYAGTWRAAAGMYRRWWDSCRKMVRIPDAVRKDFTGVFMVILKQQNGEIAWPYTEFESLGDAALAHGFRHVEFHGWGVGGHDTLYPEYDPDPAMGGREALEKGIKALQAKGLHVSVYSNGQLQQHGGTKWYDEKGYRCAVTKRDGTPMSEYWVKYDDHPGMTFDVVCPSAPDWRAQMLKICRDAKALGFQGFFYDQIGKQWPSLCFDTRHGHKPGEFVYTHDRETMLLDVIGAMHKVDPDFVLWSESFNDTILDSVALYQGLFYVKDAGYNAANRFVEGNSCDMFPEMTFYVFPELIMCDRNSTSLCTRKRANGCAATNLRVDFEVRYRADRQYVEHGTAPAPDYYANIHAKPNEMALMKSETWRANRDYLKCVSDFRRANGDLLLCGTFKADEGFGVKGGGKIIANRWDGKDGETGILVWNADDKPASVKVSFDGSLLSVSEPERGEVDANEPIPPDTLRLYRYRHVPPLAQNAARVREIQAMLRPQAGFAETRIGNREFWDRIAATGKPVAKLLEHARKIAAAPVPAPDDAKYMEYGAWTQPLHECRKNMGTLALAECVEDKGTFLPKIVEYLEMFSTRRCWTGRYHDRKCLSFNGKIHIIELGNGQVAQDLAIVLDVLRERLPADVRARALAALRLHCLDTYLGIARDPKVAGANQCGWFRNFANWNAACNEYMVSAAIHALDDPAERAAAIELAERSIRYYLSGFTKDGLCKEGAGYWSYGFGQYMRLALWVRRATGSFLSFIRPGSKDMFESCNGSSYNDIGGPSFGDCNRGDYVGTRHLGGQIWPEYDIYDAASARFLGAGLSDFMMRAGEFRDPEAFFARKRKPFAYPPRSWYPAEIAQLVCRPDPGAATAGSIYCAIQGSYNTRPHGHHDVGSYCIAVGGVEVMGDPGNVAYDLDTFGPKRFENPMRNSYGHPVPKVDGHLQSKGLHSRAHVLDVSFSDGRDSVVYDMKDAYREATNLVALTRTMEYLRTEGRVVVTDKVAFDGKGAFETALVTFGKIADEGNGEYVFTSADGKVSARCRISVKSAKWHLAQDRLPMEAGSQFARAKKTKPLRAAVVLDEPVHEAEVAVSWSNAAKTRRQESWTDTTWWDPYVDDIADSDTYLRRKFRQDVTDRSTGIDMAAMERRLEGIVRAGKANGEPWRMTKAKCFAAGVLEQAIDVSPLDWFPAIAIWDRRSRPIWGVIERRAKDVNAKMLSSDVMERWRRGNDTGTLRIWQDFDHSVPDWREIMKIGFPGMKERLEKYAVSGDAFYESNRIAMDAMLKGIDRFIEQGRKNLGLFTNDNCHNCSQITNTNSTRSTRLKKEIACLERLRSGAPQTAYDMMMFVWLYFFWSEHVDGLQCRSLSELDVFLTPYYEADIAAGRTTEAEFREQLKHFIWQWGSAANYWNQPAGFGGTNKDGTSAFNHVSKIILDVFDECALPTPKLLVKVAPNTPDWAMDKMLDMARRHRSISFVGEEPAARALKKWFGASEEDCRTMVMRGCYEFGLRDSVNMTDIVTVNFPKQVELMLEEARNGKLSTNGSFALFKDEYLRRLADITDESRDLAFECEKVLPEVNPAMCMTLATEHALKTRKDGFANGCPRGNDSAVRGAGLGTAVDSLLAVKEIVYERGEMSLAELGEAMAANWKGHEALRARMLRSKRKWGNNDPEANALGARIIDVFSERVNGRPNSRGGIFFASGHFARHYIMLGARTGATPDGRKKGEEISKNLSPAMGADTEGATALVETLASSDVTKLPGDYPLDVMLHPSVCSGDKGIALMKTLVRQFHRNGGSVIQFTVFSAEELRDAQAHPERYENLQVRVCGWNVRWNDMCKAEQDAYILRAENIMKGW